MSLFAQETKDGFIIINNGQFKYGNIQIDNSDKQHTECLFKESSRSEFRRYSSEEIEGYGVINGRKYITREIEFNSERRKIFLKTEFEGLIKLYTFQNRIFVEETSLIELHQDGNAFKNSLTDLLKLCKGIDRTIGRTNFDIKSITALLERYESCSKSSFVIPKKFAASIEGVVGFEFNSTRLKSNISELYFANVETLKDKTLLSAGLRVQISVTKIRALSLCTGLYFYQQQFYLLATNGTNTDKLNLDFNEFVVPVNFQYSLLNENKPVRPYFRGGISIPFTTKPSLKLEHVEESNNVIYFDQYDNVVKSLKESIQLDVAAGLNFTLSKRMQSFIELHYNTGKGEMVTSLSNTETISSTSKRINIVVGIRF
ncbi:MAG TPA: hypothetical protein PKU83_01720 [Chryseolinea sp.]|nr:hypothetical protein [Chryseolinea sp.]